MQTNKSNNISLPKYAFLMIDYETPQLIKDIHSKLSEDDLYIGEDGDNGIELETHVTLVPCLDNSTSIEDLKQMLMPLNKYRILLNNISLFENEMYDVLKCDAQCQFLHDTNNLITSKYPTFSNYKEYHPHVTIAYVKKCVGNRFVNDNISPLIVLKPKHFHYSYYDNNEQKSIFFK